MPRLNLLKREKYDERDVALLFLPTGKKLNEELEYVDDPDYIVKSDP